MTQRRAEGPHRVVQLALLTAIALTIFMAEEMVRRSRATGCCRMSRDMQWFSISRSCWSMEAVRSMVAFAPASSPLDREDVT